MKRRWLVPIGSTANFMRMAFIADSIVNNVDGLYGAWLCVAPITAGMLLQYRQMQKQI